MKRVLSMILCLAVFLSSAVFIHADMKNVRWLDVKKADFLDENSNLLVYTKGDYGTGLMDLDGKDVVEYDQYKDIKVFGDFIHTISKNPFHDESAGAMKTYPDSFKLFYKRGQIFKSHEFEYIGNLKEDSLVAKKQGKYGYIDPSGKTLIEFKYDYAEDFFKGLAVVGKKKGNMLWYGLINRQGNLVFKMDNDEIINSDEKILVVSNGGLYNFYDRAGHKIKDSRSYKYASKFSGEYSVVGNKDAKGMMKYGLVNKMGLQVIAPKYDGIFSFDTRYAIFMKKEGEIAKYGLLDLNNKEVLAANYDFIGTFGDNLCPIGKDKKFGYINSNAKLVVDLKYDKAREFKNGMAAVKKGEKWGYINSQLKETVPFQFERGKDFESGLAIVKQKNKYGIIDKAGKWIVQNQYDDIMRISNDRFIAKRSKFYDLISKDGKLLLKDYDYINYSGVNFIVKKGDKYGVFVNDKKAAGSSKAKLSNISMKVDGKMVKADAYLINGSNYIRLRDMAYMLKNSKSRFDVEYQQELQRVLVHKRAAYKGEQSPALKQIADNSTLKKSTSPLYVDGVGFDLDSYFINGNNFYKLRDLGVLIGFKVEWDNVNKMISITGR